MVWREAIGDGNKVEVGVVGEEGLGGGGVEEAAVVVVGVDEGDMEAAGEAEELGEGEHGLDVALQGEGQEDHVGLDGWRRRWFLLHFERFSAMECDIKLHPLLS